MSEKEREKNVSRATLTACVLIAIVLTAVIVGSIIFAWQNSENRKEMIFREELQRQERQGLEEQMRILERQENTLPPEAESESD